MKKYFTRKAATLTVFVLMIALVAGIIGFGNINTVNATELLSLDITIAHITDVHYFPFEDCNLENPTSKDTDYYKLTCVDTKLIRESGTILNATILNIIKQNPDYLVVSGDLTSNGEIQAHYDVANALRLLQNEIRKTNPKFQIFVVPGNHDLYNPRAAKFEADGKMLNSDDYITDSETFAKIYAGLGYPNISTYDNQEELKSKFVSQDENFGFISHYIISDNAANVTYKYYYDTIGFPSKDGDRALNCLSYVATIADINYVFCGIDSTERIADSSTYGFEQKTGGRTSSNVLNWLKDNTAEQRASGYTMVGTLHHNVAPHYSMEENITSDFTLYNWEDSAAFMADEIGLRYVFTGHMHASDRSQYTTYRGNTILDFETGSLVSYMAPTRYTTISRTTYEEKVYEDVKTKTIPVDTLENIQSFQIDVKKSFDTEPQFFYFQGITDLTKYAEAEIYDIMLEKFVDGFINESLYEKLYNIVDKAVPASINFGKLIINIPHSALMKAVSLVLDDLFYGLNYQIGDVKYNGLIDMVHALIKMDVESKNELLEYGNGERGLLNIVVYSDDNGIYTLADVVVNIYKQHLIGGEAENYESLDAAAKALSENLLTTDLENNLVKKIIDTVLNPLLLDNGALLPCLLEHHFDYSKLYYDENLTDPAEIAKHFTETEQEEFLRLLDTVKLVGIDVTDGYICLNEVLESDFVIGLLYDMAGLDLNGMSLIEWAKDNLDKYLTTSFYTGIGGIINEIAMSWAIDESPDGNTSNYVNGELNEIVTAVDNGLDMGITVGDKKIGTTFDNKTYFTTPTYDDGRLPSHATATFGDDPATSVNIQFYTNHAVGGIVKYREKGTTEWTTVNATTVTEPYAYPLIDIGYFATYTNVFSDKKKTVKFTMDNRDDSTGTVKFANIHSVTLSGLKANTEYEYRLIGTYDIGAEELEYCTDVKSFKTALSIGSTDEFTVLAMTDVQAMLQSNYEDALKSFNKIKDNYNFIINCGDVVDSGKNIKQWGFSQNILSSVWGNTLTVVAAGNHENSNYALDSYYNFGNVPEQNTETGIYYSFNYGNVHFVVLNTNDSNSNGLGDKQLAWLKSDLQSAKENSDIKWTIVAMHKGLYSAGSHSYDSEVKALRGQLSSIFYDYGVDLVLQGHDHVYNATEFLDRFGNTVNVRNDNGTIQKPQGVMYITLGTMGNKYYEYRENELVTPIIKDSMTHVGQLSTQTYSTLTFKNDKLTITNNMIDNDKFPISLTIDKSASVTADTAVDLKTIKLAGIAIENNSNIFANAETTLSYLTIARNDYGSNVKVTVNDVTTQELAYKSLISGENTITVMLIPEDNNEANATTLTFKVYKLNALKINGQNYKLGTDLSLPENTKSLNVEYEANEGDKFEVVNNNLNSGSNQVILRVTTANGDVYEQIINVEVASAVVPQPKSNLTWILWTVGGVVILIGIIVTIVVLQKRKNTAA